MLDKRNLNTAAIDRIFTAVNYEVVELEDNPDRDLCRYEFFEIFVRIALVKYSDLEMTPVDMLEKLMREHVWQNA
jgi:hypothetical protein